MTVTTELCDLFTNRIYDEIPEPLLGEIKRLLLDFVGVCISGSQSESGRIASSFAQELGGHPEATIIGTSGRVNAVNAAFANAISSHSIELDDVDEEALYHYGPPIMASALAVAESVHSTGKQFLTAVTAGCETMARLSRSVNPSLRNRGFHTTPTCGVFGATVASGLLLSLTSGQLVSALGLAGAQASGLMEMYGISMQKRFNPGPAARNGVTAALLAQRGFTGADSIIEGERGFAAAFSDSFDQGQLLEGLGKTIPVLIEFKPYSCARPIHNAIDCVLELRAKSGIGVSDVKTITVFRHPTWARYHQSKYPRSYHEAQMSLPYSVALAFVEGKALPAQYQLVDSEKAGQLMAFAERVVIKEDPSLLRGVSCRLVVETINGEQLSVEVDYPRGSVQRPLTDEEMVEKFTSLVSPEIDDEQSKGLVDTLTNLETLEDMALFASDLRAGV